MLYQKYPELKHQAPNAKTYTRLDNRNQIVEKWVKDENGQWKDITAQEIAKQNALNAQKEYEMLLEKLAKLQNEVK